MLATSRGGSASKYGEYVPAMQADAISVMTTVQIHKTIFFIPHPPYPCDMQLFGTKPQ